MQTWSIYEQRGAPSIMTSASPESASGVTRPQTCNNNLLIQFDHESALGNKLVARPPRLSATSRIAPFVFVVDHTRAVECRFWHMTVYKLSNRVEHDEFCWPECVIYVSELQAHPALQRADAAARWTPGHGSRSEFLATGERVLHWLRRFVYFGGRAPSGATGRTEIYDASTETPSLIAMTWFWGQILYLDPIFSRKINWRPRAKKLLALGSPWILWADVNEC